MIDSLEITNFRCFERFEAQNLARVNLLVGMNNSGKTSLLEAIELWAARGGPPVLERGLSRRGERYRSLGATRPDSELAVRHLLHGHALEPGRFFEILAVRDGAYSGIRATIEMERVSPSDDSSDELLVPDEESANEESSEGPLVFRIDDRRSDEIEYMWRSRLSADGGLPLRYSRRYPRTVETYPARLISTSSLTPDEVATLFGEYVLTEEEQRIVSALQIIEPSIERLALAVGDVRYGLERGGIFIRCSGQRQRIPIGSMGDGIWRMLALTLALVSTRGGILLVDEIDTGLHFSVMTKMWKLVIETAQRLDVQVFATSHSRDCYESLATALYDMQPPAGTAAVHRIERDKGRTVTFNQQQIVIAAERDIEVR